MIASAPMRIGSRELSSVSVVIFLAASPFLVAQDSQTPAAHSAVERNVAVPMRDGVVLRADVLRPSESGKFPVLVYRTPYGKYAAQE